MMADLFFKIEEIKEYYKELEKNMKHGFKTKLNGENGIFRANYVSTFVDIIVNGIMKDLDTSNIGDLQNLKFLDAGCGDSRSLAVASLFGFDAYGIDLDENLIKTSEKASNDLYGNKIIPLKFKVVKGSFNHDRPYKKLGISMNDLDYILHSINSMSLFDYMDKFSKEAKSKAKLILLGGPFISEFKSDIDKYDNLSMSEVHDPIEDSGIQGNYAFITNR